MAMVAGAMAVLPVALMQEGWQLFSPSRLGWGLGVAILASALPYSLEMAALRRLPVKVFGVLMSMEPVVATGMGLAILGGPSACKWWWRSPWYRWPLPVPPPPRLRFKNVPNWNCEDPAAMARRPLGTRPLDES